MRSPGNFFSATDNMEGKSDSVIGGKGRQDASSPLPEKKSGGLFFIAEINATGQRGQATSVPMGINPKRGGWKENEYIFSSGKSGEKREGGRRKINSKAAGDKSSVGRREEEWSEKRWCVNWGPFLFLSLLF